ncbi:Protein asteroid 1 [Merluccius polli]|uniref:Protein asteroid 1 n=1 Tax=Merluccius polli TaxID=89951 RepID=A0AA47N881_MERPO|nr:Protein asteroid 1 [Merluccius polli]
MGVRGLNSLLPGNSQIYQDIPFKDSMLVVDGKNLAYHLYYHLYFKAELDQNHGGEYQAYQTQVKAFFTALADCGIRPYVVMDGGSGTSEIKLQTIMDRTKQKVKNAHDAALTGEKKGILPILTEVVFDQTLSDMNVPLAKCFGEADCELAALASEWRCPVLSKDSDFFIFNLPAGLLHLDHFRWDEVQMSGGSSYIPCKQYTTSRFCTFFNITPELLPVFASLAGNDYINLREVRWARFLPAGRQEETSRTAGLEGLLNWLTSFRTTEETLTAAMALPGMSQQALTEVRTAMLEYRLPSSSLRGFFSEGTAPSLPPEMTGIPDWFCMSLVRGDLGSNILDVLVHKRQILGTQVERSDLQSSNLISRPVRQVYYGLLLGQGGDGVKEVQRVGGELISIKVQPVVQGAAQTLRLDSLPQADPAVRLQVCLETLGVKEETLEGVPAHLRLPVAATCYWLRMASPEPDLMLLKALLMVMVQGELNRREGSDTGWQGYTNHTPQLVDSNVAHSFNQWQACLKNTSELNLLLCMPLPKPHLAWLYQGRLAHRRLKRLQEGKPEVNSPNLNTLYRSLLEAVRPYQRLHKRWRRSWAGLKAWIRRLDRPMGSVKTCYRTKDRRDRSRNGAAGEGGVVNNSQIYQDIPFKDTNLVVDGRNLAYHLYFTANLDQNHGGEYQAYQTQVQAFFTALADCGITPYVVMNGSLATSKRTTDRVQRAHDAALTGRSTGILPILSRLVFNQTLSDMNVALVNCIAEADCELAALASEWRCPVLSKDSDFFIFNLPAGILHLDHFRWDEVQMSGGSSYIPCKLYTTSRFCTFFNITPELLPVFASLAGNDYINLREVRWAQFLPAGRQEETSWTAGLEGLLIWLTSFKTTEETLTAAMALPGMSQQALTEVRTAMLEYRLPSSSLRGFFSEGTAPSLPPEMTGVPDWLQARMVRGDLGSNILDVLKHRNRSDGTQVQRSELQSSNLTSQPIRQVYYGLLLGQGGDGVMAVQRVGQDIIGIEVQPVVQGAAKTLRLDSLPQADPAVRLQVCLETLGVKEETLKGVPAPLRLPVAATCYWLRMASPEPDLMLLKALLMVMVQGELNRREGSDTGWQGYTNHTPQLVDSNVAHSFNQWQTCLKNASELNLLLCMPLPKPHFAWLYQGRLAHRRLKRLQEGKPEVNSPNLNTLYRSLLEAVRPYQRLHKRWRRSWAGLKAWIRAWIGLWGRLKRAAEPKTGGTGPETLKQEREGWL